MTSRREGFYQGRPRLELHVFSLFSLSPLSHFFSLQDMRALSSSTFQISRHEDCSEATTQLWLSSLLRRSIEHKEDSRQGKHAYSKLQSAFHTSIQAEAMISFPRTFMFACLARTFLFHRLSSSRTFHWHRPKHRSIRNSN